MLIFVHKKFSSKFFFNCSRKYWLSIRMHAYTIILSCHVLDWSLITLKYIYWQYENVEWFLIMYYTNVMKMFHIPNIIWINAQSDVFDWFYRYTRKMFICWMLRFYSNRLVDLLYIVLAFVRLKTLITIPVRFTAIHSTNKWCKWHIW